MTSAPRRNALNLLAAHTTERDRTELANRLASEFHIPPAQSRRIVVAVLSWMRTASAPVRRFSRDPAQLEARRDAIIDQLRAGASIKAIAQAMNLSAPRVSQIIKEASQVYPDLPKPKRGRARLDTVQLADALALLQGGHTYAETQAKLVCSAQDLDFAVGALRKRAETVPDRHELSVWRGRLDRASKAFAEARHTYETCEASYTVYGASQEEIARAKEEYRKQTADAYAELRSIKDAPPRGVMSTPSLEHRVAAEKARIAAKEAIKPLPKAKATPAPKTSPKPAPEPAKPLAATDNLKPELQQVLSIATLMQAGVARKKPAPPTTAPAPMQSLMDPYWDEEHVRRMAELERGREEARKQAALDEQARIEAYQARKREERAEYIAAELASLEDATPEGRRMFLEWADDDMYAAAAERWPGTVPQRDAGN